jgi:hypothetical protein
MKRRIVPGGILALSLAVVLMAATASTATADVAFYPWNCPPAATPPTTIDQLPEGCIGQFSGYGQRKGWPGPTFNFGGGQVGKTSPAQRFALGVGCRPNVACNETFTPRISVSGDYAQTNNCPPTLAARAYPQIQGCLINLTFAPTGTGRRRGTLSTAPGGPTVALNGTGVTTPTPWGWPLKLKSGVNQPSTKKMRKIRISATTNLASTVVASGDVKRTTKQLKGGKKAVIKTKLKRPGRLVGSPEACLPAHFCHRGPKIKVRATNEFAQTDTDFHRYYQR